MNIFYIFPDRPQMCGTQTAKLILKIKLQNLALEAAGELPPVGAVTSHRAMFTLRPFIAREVADS